MIRCGCNISTIFAASSPSILGPSFKYAGMSVNQIIAEGLPTTLKVGVLALICVVALGVPLGIVAALNRNRWPDTLVMVVATIGVAVPSYVIATVALYVFALRLGWVPTFGLDDWRGYFLPVFALSGFWISFIARLARSTSRDAAAGLHDHRQGQGVEAGPDPVQARAAQLADPGGHRARRWSPTSSPARSSSSRSSPLPGIGRHFVLSITNRDYTAIMGITIFYAAVLMVMIFIVDMLYLVLDPRIKYREAR